MTVTSSSLCLSHRLHHGCTQKETPPIPLLQKKKKKHTCGWSFSCHVTVMTGLFYSFPTEMSITCREIYEYCLKFVNTQPLWHANELKTVN